MFGRKPYHMQFQLLAALGAASCAVEFSGGNDEGGVDSVGLKLTDGREVELKDRLAELDLDDRLQHGGSSTNRKEAVKLRLMGLDLKLDAHETVEDFLGRPVYDEYSSFASSGETVSGTYNYDVEAQELTLEGGQWENNEDDYNDEDGE